MTNLKITDISHTLPRDIVSLQIFIPHIVDQSEWSSMYILREMQL